MLVGFKRRFAPFVEDGSKTHTIRGEGRFTVGQRLDCYVDPRQKSMRLLGRWPCVRVEPVVLTFARYGIGYRLEIRIGEDQQLISPIEAEAFAWADGFRASYNPMLGPLAQMGYFWIAENGLKDELGATWKGEIGYWDYNRPMEKR